MLRSSQAGITLSGTGVVTRGVWHHVAAVFDGTRKRIYLDGRLDASLADGFPPYAGTAPLYVGSGNWNGGHFGGLIDEARLTSGALYASDFTPPARLRAGADTRGLWQFDGETASDSSGHANHGAPAGGAAYSSDVPANNLPPAVSLTAPAGNSVYANGTNINLTADAADADGAVRKVEFFQGGVLAQQDAAAPYSFEWGGVPAGTYTLTARATDDRGAATTSAAVTVTVMANSPPAVHITAPATGTEVSAGSGLLIRAKAGDTDGFVTAVEFFAGDTKIGG